MNFSSSLLCSFQIVSEISPLQAILLCVRARVCFAVRFFVLCFVIGSGKQHIKEYVYYYLLWYMPVVLNSKKKKKYKWLARTDADSQRETCTIDLDWYLFLVFLSPSRSVIFAHWGLGLQCTVFRIQYVHYHCTITKLIEFKPFSKIISPAPKDQNKNRQ